MLGSGAREHALAWKLAQEAEVICAPGNGGTASQFECRPLDLGSISETIELCRQIAPDLVVVGPEDPLIKGVSDYLASEGQLVFGPTMNAANLEGSKVFAKQFMSRAGVPTARHEAFTDFESAAKFINDQFKLERKLVVKASGNALGKGVIVCDAQEEAIEAARKMLLDREFGTAGASIVVEERLIGREFSLIALVNGKDFQCLPIAQDYKRIGDGDLGPNTGGMGSYSPVNWVDDRMAQMASEEVIGRTVSALVESGIEYRGAMFAGILVQRGQTYCLEFNVRFGDPETQSLVRRIGAGFLDVLIAATSGEAMSTLPISPNPVVSVSLASQGYPGHYEKGFPITVDPLPEGVELFHAGTRHDGNELVTSGGRVITVSAVGPSAKEARARAYQAVECVHFEGKTFRSDIAAPISES